MTPEQLDTLNAYIQSVPAWAALPNNTENAITVANGLNALASPDYWLWKTHLDLNTIMENGFDWVQVDNLTVGQARIWEWLFSNEARACNPSKANVRAGISEAWKGTAAKEAVRDVVLGHCKRKATVAEKIFSTGAGTLASPSTTTWEGMVSSYDVETARAV